MPQKGKLNAEEKVEIVRKYQKGEMSLVQAARYAGVGTTTIYRWKRAQIGIEQLKHTCIWRRWRMPCLKNWTRQTGEIPLSRL